METKAIVRGVRLSADKGRLVADLIRGKKVGLALNTLEFTCLNLALGCLLAATTAWIGLPLAAQFLVAVVAGGAGVALLAPVMRKRVLPASSNENPIVGAEAIVIETISPPNEGKVKLNGVIWQAVSDRAIADGTHVYVTELSGAKLTVMARRELESPRDTQ